MLDQASLQHFVLQKIVVLQRGHFTEVGMALF